MKDNKTSQPAQEYDANIQKTIPYYAVIQQEVLRLVKELQPNPIKWLDAGCGTGNFVLSAAVDFPSCQFTLSDPAPAMLEITREKLAGRNCEFVLAGTETLGLKDADYDVITALLSHHYSGYEDKQRILINCYRMLKSGGVYITLETILKDSDLGTRLGVELWRKAQIRGGKTEEAASKHVARLGTELVPSTLAEHKEFLHKVGFKTVEIFWLSGMQACIYALK